MVHRACFHRSRLDRIHRDARERPEIRACWIGSSLGIDVFNVRDVVWNIQRPGVHLFSASFNIFWRFEFLRGRPVFSASNFGTARILCMARTRTHSSGDRSFFGLRIPPDSQGVAIESDLESYPCPPDCYHGCRNPGFPHDDSIICGRREQSNHLHFAALGFWNVQ